VWWGWGSPGLSLAYGHVWERGLPGFEPLVAAKEIVKGANMAYATAIFIDGPLAQEVMAVPDLRPTWKILLPPRITVCDCGPKPEEFERSATEFTYYLVMRGCGDFSLGLYSKNQDAENILRSLKAWVRTDLNSADRLYYHCRDRRAWE